MARITGLNQCSPPLFFWAGLACFSRQISTYAVVFSRSSFVLLHAGLLGRMANGLHVLCLQCDPCLWLWNRACTPSNGNQCETWECASLKRRHVRRVLWHR